MPADTKAQLEAWIANTKRNQKKLGLALGAATLVSFVLIFTVGTIGGFALTFTIFIAIAAFWITAAHIADWRYRITQLDKPKNQVIGGGRRW